MISDDEMPFEDRSSESPLTVVDKRPEPTFCGLSLWAWRFSALAGGIFFFLVSMGCLVQLAMDSSSLNVTRKGETENPTSAFTEHVFAFFFILAVFLLITYFYCGHYQTLSSKPPEETEIHVRRRRHESISPALSEVDIFPSPPMQRREIETVSDEFNRITQDVTVDIHQPGPSEDPSSAGTSYLSLGSIAPPTPEEAEDPTPTIESTCKNCPVKKVDGKLVSVPGYTKDGQHFCSTEELSKEPMGPVQRRQVRQLKRESKKDKEQKKKASEEIILLPGLLEDPQSSGEVRRRRLGAETPEAKVVVHPPFRSPRKK